MIGCVLRATRAGVKNRLSAGESTWAVVSSDSSVVDAYLVVKRMGAGTCRGCLEEVTGGGALTATT